LAEWRLDSPHVQSILSAPGKGHALPALSIDERILVPAAIYEWKATEARREKALAVQLENRRRFQQAFSQGLAVLGFVRDVDGNGVYELGQFSQLQLEPFSPRN
jgi:hypothetical protein